jgi:hypothetical protein
LHRGRKINGSVYLYGPCLLIMGPRGDSSIATEKKKSLKKHCSKRGKGKKCFWSDSQHWHAERKLQQRLLWASGRWSPTSGP